VKGWLPGLTVLRFEQGRGEDVMVVVVEEMALHSR
jgi:hypothetical protein